MHRPVLLIILDGFGHSDQYEHNAILKASTPFWSYLVQNYSYGLIEASGKSVGLLDGQFGNSEVGHLNIGAGRVVKQKITQIEDAIVARDIFTIPAFTRVLQCAATHNLHIVGIVSNGGVHGHIDHMLVLIEMALMAPDISHVYLHLILDGRDTPPKSALKFVRHVLRYTSDKVTIATVSGRYYAMDRDNRYERTKMAYDIIMYGNNTSDIDSCTAIEQQYANGVTDEFFMPTACSGYDGVAQGDCFIITNFRADRIIQLSDALLNPQFNHFFTKKDWLGFVVLMTQYDAKFIEYNCAIAFADSAISDTLGECISKHKLQQLRVAETEKYPHVTYFFNGGRRDAYPYESRIMIPSPREVATYDECPAMSLEAVSNVVVNALCSRQYSLVVANFANGDMVGHTGNLDAAILAVESIDSALKSCVNAALLNNTEIVITADHGNCEEMFDIVNLQPHTQHTTNLVPFLYISPSLFKYKIRSDGSLKDVAPTVLSIMGIDIPGNMTGSSLIVSQI